MYLSLYLKQVYLSWLNYKIKNRINWKLNTKEEIRICNGVKKSSFWRVEI